MRVTDKKSTHQETTLDGLARLQWGPDRQLVIVAMTPAVQRLAQVARAIRQAHKARNGESVRGRPKSPPGA